MLIGYVVGLPIHHSTYHEKRMYELRVVIRMVKVLKNKKMVDDIDIDLFVYLVGNTQPIKSTDDFARVADVFIHPIIGKTYIEVETDKWKYTLWLVTENGRQWYIR